MYLSDGRILTRRLIYIDGTLVRTLTNASWESILGLPLSLVVFVLFPYPGLLNCSQFLYWILSLSVEPAESRVAL